jgi:hypothetical protein
MTSQASVIPSLSSVQEMGLGQDVSIEERLMCSIQLHYQTNHQEEFLQLKAQVESLMMEINTIAVDGSAQ